MRTKCDTLWCTVANLSTLWYTVVHCGTLRYAHVGTVDAFWDQKGSAVDAVFANQVWALLTSQQQVSSASWLWHDCCSYDTDSIAVSIHNASQKVQLRY